MAVIESWFNQDLKEPVKVRYLDGNIFSADNSGNLVGVNVFDDGEPASLSGSVSASVIRADGNTVAVTGTLSGNQASVVLPQAAYAVPGVISIVIKLTSGTDITTLCAVVANVYMSTTDNVVDPGTIIPSVETLISAIEAAVASIPADYSSLWTSLAPAYSTSGTYAVGDYVTYNGGLYRCVSAISSGESWTAAHWTSAKLGTDVSALKSALSNLDKRTSILVEKFDWVEGYYNLTDGVLKLGSQYVYVCTQRMYDVPMNLINASIFDEYPAVDFMSFWNNGVYAGYYMNGAYKLPDGTTVDSITYDCWAISINKNIPNYDTLMYYSLRYRVDDIENKTVQNKIGIEKLDNRTAVLISEFEWEQGYYTFTDGSKNPNNTYRRSLTIKTNQFRFVDNSPFIEYPNNNFVSFWNNGVYAGYYLNNVYKLPDGTTVDSITYDEWAVNMIAPSDYYTDLKPYSLIDEVRNEQQSPWSGKTANFIGDSITRGAYTPTGGSSPDQRATKRYCEIACEFLGMSCNNYGISGTSISGTSSINPSLAFVNRYSDMANNADLIVVAGGTNDYGTNVVLGTIADTTDVSFYGALYVLCNGLQTKYLGKRIIFITPICRLNETTQNSDGHTLEDYRKAIEDVAGMFGFAVIDGKSMGVSPVNPTFKETYMYDGTHPNPPGHEVFGQALAHKLLSI